MRERPVLFSAPMVRAILNGCKTQTRRVVKPQPEAVGNGFLLPLRPSCPYGYIGDRLWVKETWRVSNRWDSRAPRDLPFDRGLTIAYAAGGSRAHDDSGHYLNDDAYSPWDDSWIGKTRVSIHMPRTASRLTLEVTGVRVERLQDISEADAIAEGLLRERDGWRGAPDLPWFASPVAAYRSLWESINGTGSWDANPWVRVVEFRRIEQEARAA